MTTAFWIIDSRVRMRPSTNACSLLASSYSGVFWAPTISLASCMRWATSALRTLISSSSSFCSWASPSLVRGTDLPGMAITPRPCEKRDWGRVYPQSSRCSRRFRRYYRAAPAACKEGELAGFAEKGRCVTIRRDVPRATRPLRTVQAPSMRRFPPRDPPPRDRPPRRDLPRPEGPFDRLLRARGQRDPAPFIIGGTVVFLAVIILLVFLLSGVFGGGDGDGTTAVDGSGINATQGEMPALPPGLVALRNFVEFDTDGDQDRR